MPSSQPCLLEDAGSWIHLAGLRTQCTRDGLLHTARRECTRCLLADGEGTWQLTDAFCPRSLSDNIRWNTAGHKLIARLRIWTLARVLELARQMVHASAWATMIRIHLIFCHRLCASIAY